MKKILFVLFVLMASVSFSQGVRLRTNLVGFAAAEFQYIPGYTKLNVRYEFVAMVADSGLHVPQYNGVPSGVRTGVWMADGAVAVDTLNGYFYWYSGSAWIKGAKYSDIGAAYTASNGITLSGSNFKLGGTLVDATTTIDVGSNILQIGRTSGSGVLQTLALEVPSGPGNGARLAFSGGGSNIGGIDVIDSSSTFSNMVFNTYRTSGAFGEVMRLKDRNLGIGTSNPTSLLHVAGVTQMGTAGSTLGQLLISGNTSGTITIQPAAAAGTYTLTLPTNDGDASQFLQTNGSGVLSWAAGSSVSPGEQGQIYQTSNGAAAWKYDTTTLVTFNAGANFAADTAAFTDSTIYGSFKLMGNDTFYVTGVSVVLYSNNAITDTLGIQITYNDTINVIGSHVFAATYAVNNGTTGQDADGDDFTGSNSVPIPPGNWVWLKSPTVVAGRKPYHMSVSIIGYKKRVN